MDAQIPTLVTERLVLRKLRKEDMATYAENFLNWSIVKFLSSAVPWPYPSPPEQHLWEWVSSYDEQFGVSCWIWGIFLKSAPDEAIGNIHIEEVDGKYTRGFWLAEKHWRQGLMTEATSAVNDYLFSDLGLDELHMSNAKGNTGSRRIKEKTGAKFLEEKSGTFKDPDLKISEHWILTKKAWLNFRRPKPKQ